MPKFNPSKPATVVDSQGTAHITPAVAASPEQFVAAAPQTNSERILKAQSDWMEIVRRNNLPGEFGFNYSPAHFEDVAGQGTSVWLFEALTFLLWTLRANRFAYIFLNGDGTYLRRKGLYVGGVRIGDVSIADFKKRVTDRCKELGISEAKVWEYFSRPHSASETALWDSLPFNEQMAIFKEKAEASHVDLA